MVTVPLRRGYGALRAFADRRARRRVLVLGDSHVRVFEHWLFLFVFPRVRFDVIPVPGGSALGILSHASHTGTRTRFLEALDARRHDAVIVGLGEVDADHAVWITAERRGEDVETVLARSLERYLAFLDDVARRDALIVLAASLPTVATYPLDGDPVHKIRAATGASQRRRTELALRFNAHVAEWCGPRGIPHLDTAGDALGPDGLVRRSWCRSGGLDHHYVRGRYARWLVARLRPILRRLDAAT